MPPRPDSRPPRTHSKSASSATSRHPSRGRADRADRTGTRTDRTAARTDRKPGRNERTGPRTERTTGRNERTGPRTERTTGRNERTGPRNERPTGRNERTGPRNERPTGRNERTGPRTERTTGRNERTAARTDRTRPRNDRKRPRREPRPQADSAPLDSEKLHKVIARAGIASRRQCEWIISEGRVTVDGKVVRDVACRVDAETQSITVDGEALPTPKPVHFAFHKPRGVVCTNAADEKRPRVIDYFRGQSSRLFTVGRLDEESEGLILVTNDGRFSQHIAHPRHEVTKTYEVTVIGRVSGEELAKIRKGVWISDGKTKVHGAFVRKKTPRFTILHIVLAEGRNREVRRIFARIGFRLRRLRRIAIGPVELRDLKPGQHRPLHKNEFRVLTDLDGNQPPPSIDA